MAGSIHANLILVDEKSARQVAAERGLRAIANRGSVDLATSIDQLTKTNQIESEFPLVQRLSIDNSQLPPIR